MIEKIKRQLDRLEESMAPPDQPEFEFILAFVKPAEGAQPRKVRYCKYGAGKLEPVNLPDQPEDEPQ